MDSAQNETINVFICQRCDQQFMGKTSRKICPPCGTLRKCPDCSIKVNIKTAKCKCGKVLYKGKEQKLEERRQAGADMKRNPGYAIDQLRAAAAYAYGAGYGVFAVAFKQGPGDNYLRQIVIKEGLPDYSEEEAASLNHPNWSLLRQSAISTMNRDHQRFVKYQSAADAADDCRATASNQSAPHTADDCIATASNQSAAHTASEPVSPPSTEDSVVGNQQLGSTEEESIVTGLPKKILRHRKKKNGITEYLTSWQDDDTYFSYQEEESFAAGCPVFAAYMKKLQKKKKAGTSTKAKKRQREEATTDTATLTK